ncbi:hypothetical protein [Deinococcus multiflagellatus]|uniref:Serine protease n=1 Tax=Deinococcus multiflagellatus TaxID=1656887 RepID=A0ABW1ZVA9_9DEIO
MFGGYEMNRQEQAIILYTANSYRGQALNDGEAERGRKIGLMRKAFVDLMEASELPLITENGIEATPKKWKIKFKQTDASLDDLLYWKASLFIDANNHEANLLAFDMTSNSVIVQAKNEALKGHLRERLKSLGIPEAKVTFRTGNIQGTKRNDVDQYRPVVGGVKVEMANGGLCTLGLPVLLDGTVEGYLTAGHCVQNATVNNGESLRQDSYTVGTKFLDPAFQACTVPECGTTSRMRQADAAFFRSSIGYTRARIIRTPLTPGTHTTLQNADGSDQYWDVTSTPGLPGLSEAVQNIGMTSGYRSAAVTNQFADIRIDFTFNGQTVRSWVLRTVEVYNDGPANASCRGDSGSPWFQQIPGTTNQVRFFGIQSAAQISPTESCGQYAYFSPVTMLENHFGAGRINYKR